MKVTHRMVSIQDADLERMDYIEQRGSKWVVLSESGKVLGEHDTREEAVNHLQAIEANK